MNLYSPFPLGAIHHADYFTMAPPLELDNFTELLGADIAGMRDAGFTTYNLNVAWGDVETAPGDYDWSRADAAFRLARQAGLGVFVWLFCEVTPAWFGRRHPSGLAVSAKGGVSSSHSYASGEAQQYLGDFIAAAARRYPPPEGTIAYNVGVESGFFWLQRPAVDEASFPIWDYAEESLEGFASWLEAKYSTVAELNRRWRSHHQTFRDATPPRNPLVRDQFMLRSQVPWLDWRAFMVDSMTDYIAFKAAQLREAVPEALVADQSFEIDPARHGQDIWAISQHVDLVGTSVFVGHGVREHLRSSYAHDYFRSAAGNRAYCVWELRSDQDAWGLNMWGPAVTPEDVGRYLWQSIAHEARSVQFWNWRPHIGGLEVGGHGLTTTAGGPTGRLDRVSRIARTLRAHGEWLATSRLEPARIAILDTQRARIAAVGEGGDELVTDASFGLYSLFRQHGARVDFLDEDALEQQDLDRLRVIAVPLGYLMSAETAAALQAWTHRGGTLVAGLWCAAKDADGYGQPMIPGHGLDAVFGASQAGIEVLVDGDQRSSPLNIQSAPSGETTLQVDPAFTLGESLSLEFGVRSYYAPLEVSTATPIVRDHRGRTVGTLDTYGAGRAVLLGFVTSRPAAFVTDGLTELIGRTLSLAEVDAPAWVLEPDATVETELLTQGDRAVLIAMNPGDAPAAVRVRLSSTWSTASDLETGQPVSVSADELSLSIRAGDARAVLLERSMHV